MSANVATEPLLTKAQILESFKELPDRISANALIEHILFMQSVANGIEQAALGNTTPHEQAMRAIRSWPK